MKPRTEEQVRNSLHNLSVTHEKLCAEYHVIRSEGGHETAQLLARVCENLAEKIKDIHAQLLIIEALKGSSDES